MLKFVDYQILNIRPKTLNNTKLVYEIVARPLANISFQTERSFVTSKMWNYDRRLYADVNSNNKPPWKPKKKKKLNESSLHFFFFSLPSLKLVSILDANWNFDLTFPPSTHKKLPNNFFSSSLTNLPLLDSTVPIKNCP